MYSREETAEILKIAAENSHSAPPEESVGLSERELRDIARESGINPVEIDRAIAQVSQDATTKTSSSGSLWGGPFVFSDTIELDHEISSAEWELLLAETRAFFRSKGDVTSRENVYEWSSPWDTTNAAHVTALVDSGKTTISVNWNGPLTPVPFFIPVPLVSIASVLLASGPLGLEAVAGLSLAAGATVGSFALARWGVKRHMAKGIDQLRGFVQTLQEKATRSTSDAVETATGLESESVLSEGEKSPSPLIEMDLEERDSSDSTAQEAVRPRSRE